MWWGDVGRLPLPWLPLALWSVLPEFPACSPSWLMPVLLLPLIVGLMVVTGALVMETLVWLALATCTWMINYSACWYIPSIAHA
jgi:hypothetical protein